MELSLAQQVPDANHSAPDSLGSPFSGYWEGTMISKGMPLPVSFSFDETQPVPSGLFTSLTQRAMDYPLDSVSEQGTHIQFVLGGNEKFDGRVEANKITGTFGSEDETGTFVLRRSRRAKLPYDLQDVLFSNGPVQLAGTLALPRTPGRHPAVVLLQGSGPETRWGTNRFIADRMARAGIAALIYDQRGSGKSTGDWKTASFTDLAKDALSAVALLQARTDIDPAKIGLHGHSQGGIIAAMATTSSPTSVAFVVAEDTVAGPVWKQDIYRVHNALAREFKAPDADAAMRLYDLFIEVATGNRPYKELEDASASVTKQAWFQWLDLPPRDSWLWAWYAKNGTVNTLDYWRTVRVPVLLVYGEHDELVPVDESISNIEKALDEKKVPYTALIAPAAEHNLTVHPQPGQAFFWWHAAPGIIDTVDAWIRAQETIEAY
jgi:hypothetical protein